MHTIREPVLHCTGNFLDLQSNPHNLDDLSTYSHCGYIVAMQKTILSIWIQQSRVSLSYTAARDSNPSQNIEVYLYIKSPEPLRDLRGSNRKSQPNSKPNLPEICASK